MKKTHPTDVLHDFLGSAQIFTSAVNDLLEEQLREAGGPKVTFSQLKLLKMVSLTEDYTVSNVAAYLGVSNAAASKAVDRLVRRRLLKRAAAEADRRAVRLSLTETGRRLLTSYEIMADEQLAKLFGDFPRTRLRETAELLDRLSVSIVARDGEGEGFCFRCGLHFRERCLLRKAAGRSCYFHEHKRAESSSSV
ncbi:MAG: winged helix-turn-helix transcriptional regulator [Gemmatimonadota bacterium]|nr:MAG: winged helix-turn-helix transcriptional regulator [Gemmatimonadota bacterium]